MEFSDEIIKKLGGEGYSFTKGGHCTVLTYLSAYEHVVGKVYAGTSTQGFVPHFSIMHNHTLPGAPDDRIDYIVRKQFGEGDDLEKVLRSVAEAVDALDYGLESADVSTSEYKDLV